MRIGRINGYTEEKLLATATAGLSFIEVCCNNQAEAEAFIAAKDSVKSAIAKSGIDVSSVGRWNHDVNENGKLNEEKLAHYLLLLDTAIELGAKTFVCGINKAPGVSLYQNYTVAIDFFAKLLARANGRIKIAVQNCTWNNFIATPKEWEVVLGELPELGLKYDPSHAYNRGDDYLAEMHTWGERIAHFHIKGTTYAGSTRVDDPPAGMDDIKWGPVFAVLYAKGYDGDLSIEPHSKTWRGELGAFGVEFTRSFIKKFVCEK